jgi:lipid II:glycine glycyltransferase (peptidoglycan interpeptide bridge formation enzyme)
MIIYKNRYLTYCLAYFDEYSPHLKTYHNLSNIDIIYENQYTKKRLFSHEFYTMFIDLTLPEEKIFSFFEKNTQYEIKRANGKDFVTTITLNAKTDKLLFYDFYDKFIQVKGLHPLGIRETDLLIDNDMFIIRSAIYNDEKIVFHTYITENNRARLAQSASLFRESQDRAYRNLIGRANRLLHWEDMLYFKQKGYLIYDLGGISMESANQEAKSINQFKKSFGGSLVKEYNSIVPVSLKGYFYLLYRKITGKTV